MPFPTLDFLSSGTFALPPDGISTSSREYPGGERLAHMLSPTPDFLFPNTFSFAPNGLSPDSTGCFGDTGFDAVFPPTSDSRYFTSTVLPPDAPDTPT